jgi:hypothetical protein
MATTLAKPLLILLAIGLIALWLMSLATHPAPSGRLPSLPVGMPRTRELPYELPPLTEHALEHEDAEAAWSWVQHNGRFCRWQCPDGGRASRATCGARPAGRWSSSRAIGW